MGTQWEDLGQLRAIIPVLSSSFPDIPYKGRPDSSDGLSAVEKKSQSKWRVWGQRLLWATSELPLPALGFLLSREGGRIRKQRDSQALLHLPSLSWIIFHPRLKCVSLPVNHWFAIWDRKTELGEKQWEYTKTKRRLLAEGTKGTSNWVTTPRNQNYVDTLYKL